MLWYTVLYVVHVVYCGNQHWTPAGHAEGFNGFRQGEVTIGFRKPHRLSSDIEHYSSEILMSVPEVYIKT